MGWGNYLVDKKNKIAFYLSRTDRNKHENSIEEVNTLNQIIDKYIENDDVLWNIGEKKIKNISEYNINEIAALKDGIDVLKILLREEQLYIYLYYIAEKQYREDDFKFISEQEFTNAEYKNYTVID